MTAAIQDAYRISLASEVDLEGWRDRARRLLQAGIAPDQVTWTVEGRSDSGELDLSPSAALPEKSSDQIARPVRISKTLLSLINTALLHRNEDRFDLGYRLLYRAQSVPSLHRNPADADMLKLNRYAKAIRRDIHKMHAFVRFRKIGATEGREQFVAWFEPDHHITEAVAPFFRNRFTGMDWLIVTPEASIAWDGEKLAVGPGGCKDDVPQEDVVEAEWRTYYANIFNPARVKISAMKSEMPMKYWKNLPEAELIPSLLEQAGTRVEAMVAHMRDDMIFEDRMDKPTANLPTSLDQLYGLLEQQADAPREKFSDRLIRGIGPDHADIMIIGEQPGDQEDREGRPFVGPAGQLLDRAFEDAQIDRQQTFLTNAVKRFKFTPRGKRRIHETPNVGEINYYRWWVEQEIRLVNPKLVVALGATAARCLTGKAVTISRHRGEILPGADDRSILITVHPSFLLRIPDEQGRQVEYAKFVRDLQLAEKFVR
ncbi:UdgX family uracil-DNA binding protein [uncultured Parasphingorhabdus sp.]|uniref:UdgX family uracil-DNA binding protein n=1 Tax=uncultured Parasphingorhabdus sp. TaxID=2709694 RepID=UPI0030DAE98D|tara:strand:+ start:10491 stop:11945 length:1455 start_codon:yes stop_codon:yes gene_type:complete